MDLNTLAAVLEPFVDCPRWWIAYSGGMDSHVLLHALATLRQQRVLPPLFALHINHQLNPAAAQWQAHCRDICAGLRVEFAAVTVTVSSNGEGIEAAARDARYAAFHSRLGAGELLLQAHHRDDQIETLLLRLLRGSDIAGLAAIPVQRVLGHGTLLRPLLQYSRTQLLAYARQQTLHWIEDDSNNDPRFDRNYLRLQVLPSIARRWPGYRDTLARVTEQAAVAAQLLDSFAAQDWQLAGTPAGTLDIAACLQLDSGRRENLLRFWLRLRRLPQPTREQLRQIGAAMLARADASPCVRWPGAEVHRYRARLYALPPLPAPPAALDLHWQPGIPLAISGLGVLRAKPVSGAGLRADREYRIRSRGAALRCRPVGRRHSQTLKKLLQEFAVPTFRRVHLPLIYCGEQLAAVADIWVCEGFQPGPHQQGWSLEWQLEAIDSDVAAP